MKKTLLIAAVACLAMTSCKKEYTCECTVSSKSTIGGVTTTSAPVTTSGQTEKLKKADAKAACEKSNGTTTSGVTGFSTVETTIACSIK